MSWLRYKSGTQFCVPPGLKKQSSYFLTFQTAFNLLSLFCTGRKYIRKRNGGSSSLFTGGDNVVDGDHQPLCFPSGAFDANFYFCSQKSSNSSEADESALFAIPRVESQPTENGVNFLNGVMADAFECMNFDAMEGRSDGLMMPVFPDALMEEILQSKGGMSNNGCLGGARIHTAENSGSCKEMQLKRKHEAPGIDTQDEGNALQSSELNSFDQSPKKRTRVSRDAQKNKTRKNKKAIEINTDGEENNGQSSSTCSSEEDDSNASQELNTTSISESKGSVSNGKAKANRGPATDPQSLYARRRRERINERLRILQNLVPNGTEVDISTMLEEAVHYVKFLQLQIKLLSSDDLWMYAPIAYNGIHIGLHQRIIPNPCPHINLHIPS